MALIELCCDDLSDFAVIVLDEIAHINVFFINQFVMLAVEVSLAECYFDLLTGERAQ